jgi:SAM-dependent methyltransferase
MTRPEEHQEREYDRPYHHYVPDTGEGIPYNSLLRNLKSLIKPQRNARILDAGCGDGRLIRELRGSGALLFGVDRSAQALRFAAAFSPGAILSMQDLGALAFKDESFSTIAMIETLEHINPSAVPGVIDEVRRILITGGRLICTVPTHLHPRPPKHYRHFSFTELGSLLEEYFNVDSITGHDRDLLWYRWLVAAGDNPVWQLRAGYNKLMRFLYRRYLESCSPDRARRLIAVCRKK